MEIDRPRDLGEALAASAESPTATLLAGGTDIMVEVNFRSREVEEVISLRHVDELTELNVLMLELASSFVASDGPVASLR